MTAGCLDNTENIARCSSEGVGSGSQHLREVALIRGDEQVALGILVSDQAVTEDRYHAVQIRNTDDGLIASVPLMDNRDMSSLDPEDYSVFGPGDGELFAVPLGPPPVHGEYIVSVSNVDGERIEAERTRFNCYAEDGALP